MNTYDISELFQADTFVVINKTILNSKNNEILYRLYQPIIGSNAVNLYNTLCSYLDLQEIMSQEHTHHSLVLNMKLKLEDIINARKNLEAVGLLKSYLKKGNINNYVYEIYSPLDPIDFFKHPILNSALISKIETKEYKRIVNYFHLPHFDLSGYENISVKFNDVFESSNIYESEVRDAKKKNASKLDINEVIDVSNVISLIPDYMLNKKTVTKETIDLINKIAFLYNFSEKGLEEIIRSSINEKKIIDKTALKNNSCNFYKFENKGKLPSIIYKNQPENLRKEIKTSSLKDKVIYTYEVTSPYVFLQNKYKGGKPSQNDLEILAYLADDVKLNTGVINVLIDYVLRVNNNKLIKNFVSMVASQWKMSNVETVEEAMNISKREIKSRKVIENKKNYKKTEEKPVWFDKKIEEENDVDKQKEIEELLSQFK